MTASGNSTPAGVTHRVCTKCSQSKPETLEFFTWENCRGGRWLTVCKVCKNDQSRARYAVSNEKALARANARRARHDYRDYLVATRDRRLELKRKYRLVAHKNDAHVKAWEAARRQQAEAIVKAARPQSQQQQARAFFAVLGMKLCWSCKALHAVANFSKCASNADGLNGICKPCDVQKNLDGRRACPIKRLKHNLRTRLFHALRGMGYVKQSKTRDVIGCDFDVLKLHLEKQFTKGMRWELVGASIHVDHIVPLAGATTEAEVLALSHFTNLRPMWAADNLRKGAKRLHLL